jgi:hypothetical protein
MEKIPQKKGKFEVLFRIPNNPEGLEFLTQAKEYLNKESYLLKTRGRTPDWDKFAKSHEKYRPTGFTPISISKNLGIYLVGKSKNGNEVIGLRTLDELSRYRRTKTTEVEKPKNSLMLEKALFELEISNYKSFLMFSTKELISELFKRLLNKLFK